jgi:formylglycine-generating enzyme required for sulfatase activity
MSSATRTSKSSAHAVNVEMIDVPASEFLMGTSEEQIDLLLVREDWAIEWYDRNLFHVEQPQHTVHVGAYAIGASPVTNAEYAEFVWEASYRPPRGWAGFRCPPDMDLSPVANVSWVDATAYAKWLARKTNRPFRLPTEAEWERAARGVDGRMFPWGQDFDPWRCNTLESSKRGVTPIHTYSPSGDSPVGACDMAGNVWEWTSSLLHPYPYDPTDGREEPAGNGQRVARGGAWYYSRKLARCAAREGLQPTYLSSSLGFRLALSR